MTKFIQTYYKVISMATAVAFILLSITFNIDFPSKGTTRGFPLSNLSQGAFGFPSDVYVFLPHFVCLNFFFYLLLGFLIITIAKSMMKK